MNAIYRQIGTSVNLNVCQSRRAGKTDPMRLEAKWRHLVNRNGAAGKN